MCLDQRCPACLPPFMCRRNQVKKMGQICVLDIDVQGAQSVKVAAWGGVKGAQSVKVGEHVGGMKGAQSVKVGEYVGGMKGAQSVKVTRSRSQSLSLRRRRPSLRLIQA